ncbi:cell division peptidoglycan polymerase FtsW [Staphylococcus delphini]|uniref:Probable peptidoglycan glycosyltransferase FtsW n=4 Tax=Staphylococcus intermedius group TaxID=2815305 RepID=A0A2A4HAX6_9STAP|nr:FtsW/RodA/SpoVE family cell cycle protein [Staphylococcus delphini]MBZ8175479.1 FtsW/RodA/SpoVE family cell cycle protein [Staphylococcus delphini]MDE9753596.1 FtsW/RodA/SpoVE family cell cycle protein [Staphylococcus delphini]MDE9790810.1 FtsW/RodA/SpoVE family cell cycle protein [Staphylococcus delphini]MDE9793110.1 FtsW/RodA/SpoVE family cell cycle protein [Staphylococcus delphini]MDE9795656.1 FtsW/RodA/SpoVE family cell cycle protein [Staphylococcus delphini]
MNNMKRLFRYILRSSKYIDFPLLITYLALCFIGLTMVYSASMVAATRGTLTGGIPVAGTYFYTRQLIYVIVGFFIVFFMAYIMDVRILKQRNIQLGMMAIMLGLLFATLLFGSEINGSRSWLKLGFMNLQASELLKIAIILYVPYIIERKRYEIQRQPIVILWPIAFVGFCLGLVLLQKDVGQTLLIGGIFFSIIVYSGIGVKNLIKIGSYAMLALIVVILIIVVFRINILPSYLTARFSALENPFNYESGIGYHLSNSLLAIGNGGLFGRGLGNSIMKLGYLPEPHTDFIFAIISEELGFVGAFIVLGMIFFIVYRAFELASRTASYFYKLVCVGIASYIALQTFVNLGGISGLIPLTGVPLPFISFGGSSMLSLSIAMGLLLIIAKQIKYDDAKQRYMKKQQAKMRRY